MDASGSRETATAGISQKLQLCKTEVVPWNERSAPTRRQCGVTPITQVTSTARTSTLHKAQQNRELAACKTLGIRMQKQRKSKSAASAAA